MTEDDTEHFIGVTFTAKREELAEFVAVLERADAVGEIGTYNKQLLLFLKQTLEANA